jgi:hypothetical protein
MPWIAYLALLMIAILVLQVLGAEWSFERALERQAEAEHQADPTARTS